MIKMQTFWQYGPAILIVFGALFAAFGGFWQSYRSADFNATIRERNDIIIQLQADNLQAITGGNSFAEMAIEARGLGIDAPHSAAFIHHGKFPLYGVSARIVDLDRLSQLALNGGNILQGEVTLNVGDMTPNLAVTGFPILPHTTRTDINYNIFFSGRNGTWTQLLRMKWTGDGWGRTNRVEQNGKEVLIEVSADFPRLPNGDPDWEYYLRSYQKPDDPNTSVKQ